MHMAKEYTEKESRTICMQTCQSSNTKLRNVTLRLRNQNALGTRNWLIMTRYSSTCMSSKCPWEIDKGGILVVNEISDKDFKEFLTSVHRNI